MSRPIIDLRGGAGRIPEQPGWLRIAASKLYGCGASINGALLSRRSVGTQKPVISIGNLEVGGTGKTPATEALARLLIEKGLRPAVLTGFAGQNAGLDLLESDSRDFPQYAPDEALLLAERLPDLSIVVARRKWEGALLLDRREDCDVILLDDGFQHRRLRRAIDLVLLSEKEPGSQELLPAGPLRESPQALGRADALLVPEGAPVGSKLGKPRFGFRIVSQGLLELDLAVSGEALPSPDPDSAGYLAISAIARPERFERAVDARYKVMAFMRMKDHAVWTAKLGAAISDLARRFPDARILMTEKDAMRWRGHWDIEGKRPHCERIGMEWVDPEELWGWLVAAGGLRVVAGSPARP